ncbi:hypothetical protein ACF06X_26055 [Streptomyces sp. NPDC015346]|uniref:hypothetical protein n=1 Tax=Streptomyces sp. NPDC015346 TaxID=3364954 RepID=UPI0036FD6230
MTALAVRPLLSTAVATLALGAVALAGAPAAVAAPEDGDLKIHHAGRPDEAPRTGETDQHNEPKVCTFYLAALNFDGLRALNYTISPQPPKSGLVVPPGVISIDSAGNGFTPDLELPDGVYKVEWTWEGATGAKKSKDLKVDCKGFNNPSHGGNGENGDNGNGGKGDGENGGKENGGNSNGGNGDNGGNGKPPHGPVGAGGGGSAELASDDSSAFGIGTAVVAGVAGTAGLILIRRSRRRTDGAA